MAARFGLDVGRGSIKLLRMEKAALRGAERELDPSVEGPARRAAIVDALRELMKELGARARDELHVAIPRAEAIVKVVTLPHVKDEELEQLVRFQAARDLPFDLDDVVLTWGRLGPAPAAATPPPGFPAQPSAGPIGGEEVIVAAVRRETIEETRALVAEAGGATGTLEVSTQAAARALWLLGPRDAGEVVLVEIGKATSDIMVLDHGRLVFSRSASVGCGPRTPSTGEAPAWLDRLSHEVTRSLTASRSARGSARTGPPEALFVAGGGATVDELFPALEAKVGVKPQVLDGLAAGPGSKGAAPEHDPHMGARFVVARGLADPSPVPGVPALDLAHRARDVRARATRRRAVALAGFAAAAAIVAGLALDQAITAKAGRRAALEEERRALEPLMKRHRALEAELQAARQWEERRGRELEVLLGVARALPPEHAYLTSVRWTDQRPVTLAGRARGWDEVSRFLSALEQEPLVKRARLEQIRDRDASGARRAEEGVDFSGVVELREGGVP